MRTDECLHFGRTKHAAGESLFGCSVCISQYSVTVGERERALTVALMKRAGACGVVVLRFPGERGRLLVLALQPSSSRGGESE